MSAAAADPRADLVTVGLIAKAHGIHGELVIHPLTDDPGRFAAGATVLVEAPGSPAGPRRILGVRSHQERLLVLLEGIPDRTAAEQLRGGRLCVREADLPDLPPGQVWLHDLPGMIAVTETGEELGAVHQVLETGGERRILVLHGPRGEALVPFNEQFVLAIDCAARRITLRLIDGLLP